MELVDSYLLDPSIHMGIPEYPNTRTFIVAGSKFTVDEKYKLMKPIGYGSYGIVCSAIDLTSGETVAIKKIPNVFSNIIESKRTLREIKLLSAFNHENIVRIREILRPPPLDLFKDVYIVFDLIDTDLNQIVNSPQLLSNEHIQYFTYQILRGLKYIHSANVLHRDLKPGNLLVNGNCDLKICDFGLARVLNPLEDYHKFMTEYVATRWYRAPEIMLSWKEYTRSVDLWSVGCIIAELFLRKPLFPGRDYMHQLHSIIDILGTPSYEDTNFIESEKAKRYVRSLPFKLGIPFETLFISAPPEAIDLIRKLLTFNPDKRISVVQALKHPYVAFLHDPEDEPTAGFTIKLDWEDDPTLDNIKLKLLLFQACSEFIPKQF